MTFFCRSQGWRNAVSLLLLLLFLLLLLLLFIYFFFFLSFGVDQVS